jgi:hypothetical protein
MNDTNKRRVLVPIVGQGSITHIIRTGMLQRISSHITPVLSLAWNEASLHEELAQLGYEVHLFPEFKMSAGFSNHQSKINLWYKKFRIKTPSFKIQETYLDKFATKSKRRLVKRLRNLYYETRFAVQPGFADKLIMQESEMVQSEPAYKIFSAWLEDLNIEGLFTVTPFLPEINLVARILKKRNLPVIASIHSFDNVTKRGWQPTVFDHYLVWNKYNKSELLRIYPQLREDNITIAGAPQFDFHYNKEFLWSREEWCKRIGIPQDKKVILYSGGSHRLLPDETQYLLHLRQAFDNGEFPAGYVVLFRSHPHDDVQRWKSYVGESSFVIYDTAPNGAEKYDYTNVSNEDIKKLMSTLYYTDVHINVVSTMAVDGSAFNKPQVGPYYDEVRPTFEQYFRQMYFQEHYVPIMKSNAVTLAHTKRELIELVSAAIANPNAYNKNCNNCVEEIITFSDGQSASRAANAITKFFS